MKTIHLQIDESMIDKVMLFLSKLPKKNIKVEIEESPIFKSKRRLNSLSIKTKNFKFNRNEAHER